MTEGMLDNFFAWCIVPYDNQKRTPDERIEMLKELGLKSYAYDWRQEHLPDMENELKLAINNGIEVKAVWMWIEEGRDKPGELSDENNKVFEVLNKMQLSTNVWIGVHSDYFEGLCDEDKVFKGSQLVRYLCQRAAESKSKVALYNHGGWFGEPENQVKIIEQISDYNIGVIYNFHHGHSHIERFAEVINILKPYLWAININGMREEGPKILTVGKGNREREMIQLILSSGYKGPFGVIGHLEDADVKVILKENINGLLGILNNN